jgi:regulatory protein
MARQPLRRWISPRRSEPTANVALDTAVRYLAQRPRSEYEVRRRLRRAQVDDATIDATIGQLRRHRLLDDAAFAAYWVEQRQTFRPRGARALQAELARLGVPRIAADEATTPLENSAEEDAYRAAQPRAERRPGESPERFAARLSSFLARRGFDWDIIGRVVASLCQEHPDCAGSPE